MAVTVADRIQEMTLKINRDIAECRRKIQHENTMISNYSGILDGIKFVAELNKKNEEGKPL